MKEIVVNPIYDLVKVFNDEGYPILEIEGEYFAISEFIPSDKNVPYHKVRGKHITKIIIDHLNIGVANRVGVIQKIDLLPERELNYSPLSKYILMIK